MSEIRPHRAMRPAEYPTQERITFGPWPENPPYCVECGEEMLTLGDLSQPADLTTGDHPEWHSEEALNPPLLGADQR